MKLTPALIAEIVGAEVTAGATQVGALGRLPAKLIGMRKMRLAAVTADVFTVYVLVVVGTTTAPAAAAPHAAGDAEFTVQFVLVA